MLKPKRTTLLVILFVLIAAAELSAAAFAYFIPPRGSIDITYDGTSSSGIFLKLENHSSQAIFMQGTEDRVWPIKPVTTCQKRDFTGIRTELTGIADGFSSVIRVGPGGSLRINVDTTLPLEYKGGRCRVRMALIGGTFVESEEFTP